MTFGGNKLSYPLKNIDRTSASQLSGPHISLPQCAAALVKPAEYFNRLSVRDVRYRGTRNLLIKQAGGPVETTQSTVNTLRVPPGNHSESLFGFSAKIVVLAIEQQRHRD
jgi:hypothetical protein